MNESQYPQPPEQEASIDRLASGELDDAGRRSLLEWLDADPVRWRRCAVALLEARELEQAMGDWNAEIPHRVSAIESSGRVGTAHHIHRSQAMSHRARHRLVNVLALAASLLLAFGVGFGARGAWSEQNILVAQKPREPATDDVAAARSAEKGVARNESLPAVQPSPEAAIAPAAASRVGASELISPYVRSVLERRGYEIESRHAVLPAVLPNGRRVMLPVDQLQLRYVGHRTS